MSGKVHPRIPVYIRPASDDEWKLHGLCRQYDPEIFFPAERNEQAQRKGKSICLRCPVRNECASWAFIHDEPHGIWGGVSEQERRRLRRPAG